MSKYTSSIPRPESSEVKLCECGCGQPTALAMRNHSKSGAVKDQPQRFIKGHSKGYHKTLAGAFWAHCVPATADECWQWQGGRNSRGYGRFKHHGKIYSAHRVSYELHFGRIDDDLAVCHKCDNPICCNPHHFFLGSRLENNRDRALKGRTRSRSGASNQFAKLSTEQVAEIKQRLAAGDVSQGQLAKEYGVSQVTISRIFLGKRRRNG